MRRTLEYQIDAPWQGTTIKYFLKEKGYTAGSLAELKKYRNGVLLNGQPVYVTHPLETGDILTINIIEENSSSKINPVELPLDIIYEDEDLLIIDKPAGMPVHPSANNYDTSVANALAWYYEQREIPFVFRCINRLDKDTSGLMLVAKHFVSAGILAGMISKKNADTFPALDTSVTSHPAGHSGITREYLAIVRGSLTPPTGTIDVPIGRKEGSVIERTVNFETGERALSHYWLLEEANGHSLVALRLETGRTHQIRVHMKHIGFPLIGDFLYNPDREWINRHALHSHRLEFAHPIIGRIMTFVSPLPIDMGNVLHPSQ